MRGFTFTQEELKQIVRAFESSLEEMDAIEEQSTDFVLTTGVREEIEEALLIIEATIQFEEEIDLTGIDLDDET